MAPLDIIVMALALGASAGIQATTAQAIRDMYSGLKELIQNKYGDMQLTLLEQSPESEGRKTVVKEELSKTGIANDVSTLQQAKELLDAIAKYAPHVPQTVGVRMVDVTAAIVTIEKLIAKEGTGAEFVGGEFKEIKLGEVRVGRGQEKRPKGRSQ